MHSLDLKEHEKDVGEEIRSLTGGRGTDAVIDAVGMEAHGTPMAKVAQQFAGLLPDALGERMLGRAGVDSMAALNTAVDAVHRGGTISLIGLYGGAVDPMPMLTLFDTLPSKKGRAPMRPSRPRRTA